MATIFMDHRGFLLVEFLPAGATINSEVYCDTIQGRRYGVKSGGTLSQGAQLSVMGAHLLSVWGPNACIGL